MRRATESDMIGPRQESSASASRECNMRQHSTAGAAGLLLVDTLASRFEANEHGVELRRIAIELLHRLHPFVGHFLRHVAIVELRNAALRIRERLEADLRNFIFGFGRLTIRRQLSPALREIGVDLR